VRSEEAHPYESQIGPRNTATIIGEAGEVTNQHLEKVPRWSLRIDELPEEWRVSSLTDTNVDTNGK